MAKHEKEPIPETFKSLKDAGEFWDAHSAADYWDEMEDVECEVDIQDRCFAVLLDDVVYHAVEEMAATQGIPPDSFVNQLLRRELVNA